MMMTENQCHNLRLYQDKEEVEKPIQSMKNGNATGSDEIYPEMLRALDDQNIDVITNLYNIIYNSGVIPTDLKQSIFITLPRGQKHIVVQKIEQLV